MNFPSTRDRTLLRLPKKYRHLKNNHLRTLDSHVSPLQYRNWQALVSVTQLSFRDFLSLILS